MGFHADAHVIQNNDQDWGIKEMENQMLKSSLNKRAHSLGGVAQWIKHWPENQRVAGSIPNQGT